MGKGRKLGSKKQKIINKEITKELNKAEISYKTEITANLVHKLLSEFEIESNKISTFKESSMISMLANRSLVDKKNVQTWVAKAQIIANIVTREGKKRLISKERLKTNSQAITPTRPNSIIEEKDVVEIIQKLRDAYKVIKSELTWAVIYYLNQTTTSSSGVRFSDKKTLNRFKKALSSTISSNRWYEIEKNKSTIYLHLKHPDEKKYKDGDDKIKKRSSTSIRYIMHMLGIMLP